MLKGGAHEAAVLLVGSHATCIGQPHCLQVTVLATYARTACWTCHLAQGGVPGKVAWNSGAWGESAGWARVVSEAEHLLCLLMQRASEQRGMCNEPAAAELLGKAHV